MQGVMEKYILNQTHVRTAKNFGINDITIDMEIPQIREFANVTIMSYEMDKINIDDSNGENTINSRIGLELEPNYNLTIIVAKNAVLSEPVILEFNFDDDNRVLVDYITIIMEEGSKAEFIVRYNSDDNSNYFHYLKQETVAKENSKAKIVIANMLNNESQSFIAIENSQEKNAKIDYILTEFGGKTKISNYYARLNGDFAENNLKTIYLGTNNDIIDINYNIDVYGKSTKSNIEVQGAINDSAKKSFKGTINFEQGCSNSKGVENENCTILSNNAKSKSLPMLLCKEENVEGEHGVSSGKIDESKLFYIMSKGFSSSEAKKLIVKANFNKIIENIKNEDLENKIANKIDESL